MQNDSGSDSQGQEEFEGGDTEDVNYQSQEDSYREEPEENRPKAKKSVSESKMSSKTKVAVSSDIKGQMKSFVNVANTATEVLSHLAKKQETANAAHQHMADKDWDFAKFLYHKMKEVPEGDMKDEMQLNIQQIIGSAKRECSMQRNAATIPC